MPSPIPISGREDRIVVAQNETCRDFIPEFWEETYLPCSLCGSVSKEKAGRAGAGAGGWGRVAVDELGNQ